MLCEFNSFNIMGHSTGAIEGSPAQEPYLRVSCEHRIFWVSIMYKDFNNQKKTDFCPLVN
jgi:hypothetical protein